MRRREFLGALGGAAATWPVVARAQQAMPVVGFVRSTSLASSAPFASAFRQGLKEAGFNEGQNVAIEYRYGDNQDDRLPVLVAELIRRPVALLAANLKMAHAAKAATGTVPIVFVTGSDPVADGLVASLNRPGGNVTGVSFLSGALSAKRLQMLRQLVPAATTIAMLAEVDTPFVVAERRDVEAAAQAIGQQLIVFEIRSDGDIDTAFATIVQRGAGAVLVGSGPFLTSHQVQLTSLAAKHALPASYALREFAVAGGLMSYGSNLPDAYRQAGIYAGRILKGEKPADLPVMQSSKFEFVINLRTAKALGLEFHPQLLVTADEVIE
jgi:putative ABC transport system substrate-binding protein